jgi:hypothetical protein
MVGAGTEVGEVDGPVMSGRRGAVSGERCREGPAVREKTRWPGWLHERAPLLPTTPRPRPRATSCGTAGCLHVPRWSCIGRRGAGRVDSGAMLHGTDGWSRVFRREGVSVIGTADGARRCPSGAWSGWMRQPVLGWCDGVCTPRVWEYLAARRDPRVCVCVVVLGRHGASGDARWNRPDADRQLGWGPQGRDAVPVGRGRSEASGW